MQQRQLKKITIPAVVGLSLLTAAWGIGAASVSALADPGVSPSRAASSCNSGVPGDVNGDGFAEVAVGERGNENGRGSVHLFYGQPSGLVFDAVGSALDDQYLSQDSPGVPGKAEPGDLGQEQNALHLSSRGDQQIHLTSAWLPPRRATTAARRPHNLSDFEIIKDLVEARRP